MLIDVCVSPLFHSQAATKSVETSARFLFSSRKGNIRFCISFGAFCPSIYSVSQVCLYTFVRTQANVLTNARSVAKRSLNWGMCRGIKR